MIFAFNDVIFQDIGLSEPFDEVVKISDPNYYTVPPVNELQLDLKGQCWIQDFIVGHKMYGNARFIGRTNVAGLNLKSIGMDKSTLNRSVWLTHPCLSWYTTYNLFLALVSTLSVCAFHDRLLDTIIPSLSV